MHNYDNQLYRAPSVVQNSPACCWYGWVAASPGGRGLASFKMPGGVRVQLYQPDYRKTGR